MFRQVKSITLFSTALAIFVGVSLFGSLEPIQAAADNEAPTVLTSYTRGFQSFQTSYVMTQTQNFSVWAADNRTAKDQLQYRHSENPSFAGVPWVAYTNNQTVNLSINQPDEQTTLYVQVRDQAGNVKSVELHFVFVSGLGCGGLNTQQAVHRFWSDQNQSHFYTSNETEKDFVISSYPEKVWKYEGVAFKILTTGCYINYPVYRFWSDAKQTHFYTSDPQEAVEVVAYYPDNVWKYENIAFSDVSPYFEGASKLVHRFWSDQKQSHFYTISEAEKNEVIATYPQHVWKYEGTVFRAIE